MRKNLKKVDFVLFFFCLLLCKVQAQSPSIGNGNFEGNSSLPGCPGHDITHANNWNGIKISINDPSNCSACSFVNGSSSGVDYFNSTGTSGCQLGGPHGGNGYAVGYMHDSFNFYDVIYQSISGTLVSGTKFIVKCYVKDLTTGSGYVNNSIGAFAALLIDQSVGSSASAIGADVVSKLNSMTTPVANLTSVGGGWYLFTQTITVTSTSTYYLVLGDMLKCMDFCCDNFDWAWGIDDVTFEKEPCVTYQKTYWQDPMNCCGPIEGYNPVQLTPTQFATCATVTWDDCNGGVDPNFNYYMNDYSGGGIINESPYVDVFGNIYDPNHGIYPGNNGCVTICYTASGNCCTTVSGSLKICQTQVDPCCRISTSIESNNITAVQKNEQKYSQLDAFPNPAKSNLIVQLPSETRSIKIYNAEGTIVYEKNELKESKLSIDISSFSKGVYLISATINTEIKNKRVVIE